MSGDRISEQIRKQAAAYGSGVQPPSGVYLTGPGGRAPVTKAVNSLELAPFEAGVTQWIAGVAINVITAGNAYRIGVYADDGTGRPGALVIDLGQVSVSSTGVKMIAQGFTLPRGLWWIGGAAQSSSSVGLTCYNGAALRPVTWSDFATLAGGSNGYTMGGVSGVLPTVFAPSGVTSSAPLVGLLTG